MENELIKKGQYIETLLRSAKTVFSTKDIFLLWGETNSGAARVRLNQYVKKGKLIRLRRGIYAKDENYSRFELATRIYTPSYISFETVLTRSGVNFQYYESIFIATYLHREIKVGEQGIICVKMKDHILTNTTGIKHSNEIAMATPERAFLDRIYISKDYHFDNLSSLNWEKIFEILPIYRSKRMEKKVKEYFDYHNEYDFDPKEKKI
jgi:predicted transcriptional regulator of viral defense system